MSAAVFDERSAQRLQELGHLFRLPVVAEELGARLQQVGHDDALGIVLEVFEREQQSRHQRRVDRLRRASLLPPGKTFGTFRAERLPRPLMAKLRELSTGAFADRAVNVLAFGTPGVGKSHGMSALGHALVERGYSVLWSPAFQVVQQLLAAKRDLRLPQALKRFDAFDVMILDDIGYIQQSAEEAEVLFTLMAERYERRSLIVTSNLLFSEWDRIFRTPMTTMAAIDRLVHHAVILEFNNLTTFRGEEARARAQGSSTAGSGVSTTGRTRVRRAERRVAAGLDDNHDDNDNNDVGGEGATEA